MKRDEVMEATRERAKQGRYFNTIKPTSPDMPWHFQEYQPLRGPDPKRDDKWSDLHDCIMRNIFKQLNLWGTLVEGESPENPFTHVATRGMFVERATAMALRATEEWMDAHGYQAALNSRQPTDPDKCPKLSKINELMNRGFDNDEDLNGLLTEAYDAGQANSRQVVECPKCGYHEQELKELPEMIHLCFNPWWSGDGKVIETPLSHLFGDEILAMMRQNGVQMPPDGQDVLVEELPNGTQKIIGRRQQVQLRDHIKFATIERS